MAKIIGYAIGINRGGGVWFYVGTKNHEGEPLIPVNQYSSVVDDAMVYDNNESAEYEANTKIPHKYIRWVMATYECPTCKRRYVGYPALSRKDNKTEICPDCGMKEAIKVFVKATK